MTHEASRSAPSGSAVRELGAAETGRWSAYVERHPDGTLYHTLAWQDVVREAFGHAPRYLLYEEGDAVRGVLPAFRVACPVLGAKLISLPYDIGSSLLTTDERAERALVARAVELARESRVSYLELRCGERHPVIEAMGFRSSEPVLLSDIVLDDAEKVWSRVSKKHRQYVRLAERQGVAIREATSLDEYHTFYQVYLRVFRAFGTPPYGARYMDVLWHRLHAGQLVRVFLAEANGRCVGGQLLLRHGATLINKLTITLAEAEPLRAATALYARAIQWGLELGCRRLSLGSSSRAQTGLRTFKERWGAQSRPAVVYGLPVRGHIPSLERYYESGGLARRVWRRLPLGVTRVVGGVLNRWFC